MTQLMPKQAKSTLSDIDYKTYKSKIRAEFNAKRRIEQIVKLGCKHIYQTDRKKSVVKVIDQDDSIFGSGGVSKALVDKRT